MDYWGPIDIFSLFRILNYLKKVLLMNVGECGTEVVLGYPDLSGNQEILTAKIVQLWRGRAAI